MAYALTNEEWDELKDLETKVIGYHLAVRNGNIPWQREDAADYGWGCTLTGLGKLPIAGRFGLCLSSAGYWYRQLQTVRAIAQTIADAHFSSQPARPPAQQAKVRRQRPMPNAPFYERMDELTCDGKMSAKAAALQVAKGDKKKAASLERGYLTYCERKHNGNQPEA
jgi:hypothetical protein